MKAKVYFAVAVVCLSGPLLLASSPARAGGSKGTVLIINASSNTVTLINANRREFIAHIPVGNHPTKLVVDEKQKLAYVINQGSDDLSIINLKNLTVLTVPLGFEPLDIAATPKGNFLVILHRDPETASGGDDFKGDYSIYEPKKGKLATNFLNGTDAIGDPEVCAVVVDSGGQFAWITACAAEQVVLINLKKAMRNDSGDEVRAVIDTESDPVFINITKK